jgi:hypothetical protein
MWLPFKKYGINRVNIGYYKPDFMQCPNCKQINSIDFLVYSEYWYTFFVPMAPVEKDGHARCTHCDFRVNSIKYNPHTREEFKRIRKQVRHPWYAYIGTFIGILLLLLLVLAIAGLL